MALVNIQEGHGDQFDSDWNAASKALPGYMGGGMSMLGMGGNSKRGSRNDMGSIGGAGPVGRSRGIQNSTNRGRRAPVPLMQKSVPLQDAPVIGTPMGSSRSGSTISSRLALP